METMPPAVPHVGFDTGFFRRLHDGDSRAMGVWADVRASRATGLVSCVTLFELERLGLRGVIPRSVADAFTAAIPVTCTVVWLDATTGADRLSRAARRGHGIGLAMADALILTSLLDAGAETVYTTDSDFQRHDGPETVVLLTPAY